MKNDSNHAKKLATLLRKLKSKHKAEPAEPLDPIGQLIMSFLQWNATTKQAAAAYNRLTDAMVDHNELRVSYYHQVAELLGERYPNLEERCMRLRESLQDVFKREHGVNLDRLTGMPKREVRAYLDTLGGIPPYVAAQVTLLCFGGHAMPVDENLRDRLVAEDAADPDATVAEIESFMLRHIKAADAPTAHANLRAWADTPGRRRTAPTAAKTTKKSTSKKRSTTRSSSSRPKVTAKSAKTKTTKKKKTARA